MYASCTLPTVLYSVFHCRAELQYYLLPFDLIATLIVLSDWQCVQWPSDRKNTFFKQDLIQCNLSRQTQFHLVHIYLQILCSVNDIICLSAFIDNRSCCMLCGSALRESRWDEWNTFSKKWEKEKEKVCVYLLDICSEKNTEISQFSEDPKLNHAHTMTCSISMSQF